VINPTIKQPGFELQRNIWVTLNRIRTGYGTSEHMRDSEICACGYEFHTTKHITTECPIRKFKGTVEDINLANEEAL